MGSTLGRRHLINKSQTILHLHTQEGFKYQPLVLGYIIIILHLVKSQLKFSTPEMGVLTLITEIFSRGPLIDPGKTGR